MKTYNYLKLGYSYFLVILSFFLFSQQVKAQNSCSGTITLKTQDDIAAFRNLNCTNFTGSIIIDGGNSVDIYDLNPFWAGGMNGSGTISGDLIVRNCPGLTSLYGLDGIKTIGGGFRIFNNQNITSLGLGSEHFSLASVNTINFETCPKLSDISRLSNLSTVSSRIEFQGNFNLSDFSNFNSVTQCPYIDFYLTNMKNINGFNSLVSTSWVNFADNPDLLTISGFENLKTMSPSGNIHLFQFYNNPKLYQVDAFQSLTSLSNIDLGIVLNPSLADCCFALEMFASNPATVTINNNAFGCSSISQVNAPPTLTTCPPHRTVSTNSGTCTGTTTAASPSAADNCDLLSYNLSVLSPNGAVVNAFNIPNGISLTYGQLLPGTTKITYKATDKIGNETECFFNVTVEDNEKPVLANIPPDVTISCNDDFPNVPSPARSDNCDNDPVLTIASSITMGNCTLGSPAEIHSYSWTLTDESGNVSTEDWKVTVVSDFSFDLGPPVEICDANSYIMDLGNIGDTYSWSTGAFANAISVSASGTYSVTVTTSNGCCYIDEKMVTFSNPPSATATGGTIECAAENVQIFGSSTASGVSYSWTGPGGFTSDMQNPLVSSVGEYILTVSNAAGCLSTATTMVSGDNDIPDVSAEGGSIDCGNTSVQLVGNSTSAGVTFSWTGPDGYTSDMQNPTVNTPGIYTLNVLSNNGCNAIADANVIDNTTQPEISLIGGTLTCDLTEIELSVEGTASWTGPDGFTSSDGSISVSSPGTYAVTVTGANSCTNSESIEITSDVSLPNISAVGGIINCISGQTTLSGNSTTEGATYSWSGPGDFITEIQNPIAIIAGTYTLVVTSPNGCSASQTVEVEADMDAPEVTVNDGSIDCINLSTTLTATSSNTGITFMWTGPNGFTAESESITVMEPGEYTVMAVNENGCAGVASSQVLANNVEPTVSIFVAPLGCQLNDVSFITDVSENVSTFSWSGPNGFTSSEKEPVITDIGTYTLEVVAENGCSAMASFEVVNDAEVPDATASVEGILTCTQNTTTLMGNTTTDSVTFSWEGPDNYTSDLQNPTVSQPGTYIFIVVAKNGCSSQAIVEVIGDGEFPTVNATGGDIDCNNNSVVLSGSTNIEDATFKWEGPNGFATSISNPEVSLAGEYTFTVTTAGGCVAFKSVNVSVDNQDPDLSLSEGFINCDAGTRSFRVATNAISPTTLWTGPGGYTSSDLNATYSKAGTYNLMVTGSNGCSSQLSINVEFDIPYIHTLNIIGNSVSLEITGGTPPFEITWDNNVTGTEVSDLPDGEHFVKIIDGLDCTKFVEFVITSTNTIDIEKELDLKIYPNPVVNDLKIEWESTSFEPKNLEIISTNGSKLLRKEVAGKNSQVLKMDNLTPGVYFVKIEGKNSVIFKKFLKM